MYLCAYVYLCTRLHWIDYLMYLCTFMYLCTRLHSDGLWRGRSIRILHSAVSRKPFGQTLYNCEKNVYHCELAVCNYFVQYVSEDSDGSKVLVSRGTQIFAPLFSEWFRNHRETLFPCVRILAETGIAHVSCACRSDQPEQWNY